MMDFWEIESRVSHVTSGSRETLEDLKLIPLEQSCHGAYRGSLDVLGLEVPTMELWDEQCGPNDGFGFCGGFNGSLSPKKEEADGERFSSGVHCDDADHAPHMAAPPGLTRVKSVDDYTASEMAPKQRRYRKRTHHGRYATADDIEFNATSPIESIPSQQTIKCKSKNKPMHKKSQTGVPRSPNRIADDYDKGSVTNLFLCTQGSDVTSICSGGQSSSRGSVQGGDGAVTVLCAAGSTQVSGSPYSQVVMGRSHSCQELSPRDTRHSIRDSVASTSHVLYVEPCSLVENSSRNGGSHKRKSGLFNTSAWLRKSQEFLATSRIKNPPPETGNCYVPDDQDDLKGMTNVKVIALQTYKGQGAHELSFKAGQKLKLKAPSMDGEHGFGWKRASRFCAKKYGYFPLRCVTLYRK